MRNALEAGDLTRAVTHAEALVPLREALLAQADIVPLVAKNFTFALEAARILNDTDALVRLETARRAIFGEQEGGEGTRHEGEGTRH
jgi:hypothetical protein